MDSKEMKIKTCKRVTRQPVFFALMMLICYLLGVASPVMAEGTVTVVSGKSKSVIVTSFKNYWDPSEWSYPYMYGIGVTNGTETIEINPKAQKFWFDST